MSSIEVVQTQDDHVTIVKSTPEELKVEYNSTGTITYFAACKPSISANSNVFYWKIIINELPGDEIFLGVIGDLDVGDSSYLNATSYGWADSNEVYHTGTVEQNNESGWTKFQEGECLYFRYGDGKLTMFSVLKDAVFMIEHVEQSPKVYIHFNFCNTGTQLTLSPLSEEEHHVMISKLGYW